MKKVLHVAALAALALAAFQVEAATTFNASTTVANGQLDTTLTWESDRQNCVGSGHPAWDGPKETSGTLQLPTITLSGTYALTLTCSSPADRKATVRWVNPTQNTDGTALTNLAGIRVVYGRSAEVLNEVVQVDSASATSQVIDNLALGEWFFAAKAFNTNGAESALSNIVSKTITDEVVEAESVSLTVNPVPMNPTETTVE